MLLHLIGRAILSMRAYQSGDRLKPLKAANARRCTSQRTVTDRRPLLSRRTAMESPSATQGYPR
jgi:hypothetical protein